MSIKYVLFDLDGTLLPMDQNVFVKVYFGKIVEKFTPLGYEPERLIDTIWKGIKAMVKNDGSVINESLFWESFVEEYGEEKLKDRPYFDEFYHIEFDEVKSACGYNPEAAATVRAIKDRGLKVALATNPVFPTLATEKRISWAGLKPEEFELYTTYQNSNYCKPKPEYYMSVLKQLGANPEECLMVGNDVSEDMVTEAMGMKVFLLTDCLINKENKDISRYPQGSFKELLEFIDQ